MLLCTFKAVGLLPTIAAYVCDRFIHFPKKSALLYASMASDCHEENSDIDALLVDGVSTAVDLFEGSEDKDSDADLFAEEGR